MSPVRYSGGPVAGPAGGAPTAVFPDKVKATDKLGTAALAVADKVKLTDVIATGPLLIGDTLKTRDALKLASGTVAYPDKVKVTDAPTATLTLAGEKVKTTDRFGTHTLALADKVKLTDFLSTTTLVVTDRMPVRDTFVGTFATACPRSGTPDSDFAGDAWVDNANKTVNHGGTTTLTLTAPSAIGGVDADPLFEFDLSRFTTVTARTGGVHTFSTPYAITPGTVSSTMTWKIETFASRPFVESTVTWNTKPAAGTAVTNGTFATTALTTSGTFLITLTDANLNAMLGSWVLLTLTNAGVAGVDANAITLNSRENASPWSLTFQVKR